MRDDQVLVDLVGLPASAGERLGERYRGIGW